jgi:peptidoglycan/xylan/chitin deacetylase (PgdA/CDA1 family)
LSAVVYGSSYIASQFHFRVICKGKPNIKKQIALTFDDGVDPVQTPIILDTLKKYGIKATFFLIGKKLEGNEILVRRIFNEGHIIGNHSWSHSYWFDFYNSGRMCRELLKTDEMIENITGKKPRFFRPPYGVTNPMLKRALQTSGHLAIGWSIRSFDTQDKRSASEIINRVSSRMQSADIILFHDTSKEILNVIEEIINYGTENGFIFTGIDELIDEKAYVA